MYSIIRCAAGFLLLAAVISTPSPGGVVFLDESFDYDRDHPAAGEWLGNIVLGEGPPAWAALTIGTDDAGVWTTILTAMTARAVNTPCGEVTIEGSSVAFALRSMSAHFSGRVSADGQRLSGKIVFDVEDMGEGTFEFARTPLATDLPEPLAFSGKLATPGGKLAMTMVFARTPGGNWVGVLDVPAQGLSGLPFTRVSRDDDTITATLEIPGSGVQVTGQIVENEQRLTGTFNQGPFALEIDFPRDNDYAVPTINRPQHPEPPYPYTMRDVTVEHPDGHTLAGTLTIPAGAGPFAAAVMITGSGPQDRDETLFGHKPFHVIADYLARNGIAVLRCDDRGTGESGGSFEGATTADFATDTLAAMEYLATVEGIDARRVGLIGHSEGGVIAPMVAGLTDDVDFMVLLAGTGVPGDELLLVQAELIAKASGANEMMIAATRAQQQGLFALIRQGLDEQQLQRELRPILEAQLEMAGLEDESLHDAVEAQIAQVTSPWMRYFVTYDPRPALTRVACPVFALNGTLDLQVYHDQNLPEIQKAIKTGGGDVTIRRYQGLNHLFQPAETGLILEYATIEITFDEAVLRDIVAWILENAGS
ncbi:MAG: alpha/beta fold hydrolase [Phycisphaerales bacterium]